MQTSAVISEDRKYRYRLDRWWSDRPRISFLMLNPSTADETVNDPTITRLIGYSKAWNLGGFTVVNLFALRATDPKELRRTPDPIGPENNRYIMEAARSSLAVLIGWGTHGAYMNRGGEVRSLLLTNGVIPLAFGSTKDGYPKHPLYLKSDATPSPYGERA